MQTRDILLATIPIIACLAMASLVAVVSTSAKQRATLDDLIQTHQSAEPMTPERAEYAKAVCVFLDENPSLNVEGYSFCQEWRSLGIY